MTQTHNQDRITRSRRRTGIAIAVLITLWAAAMLNRHTLRANYYIYRLAHSSDTAAHAYYFSRLCAMGDGAVGVAGRLLAGNDRELRTVAVGILHHARSDRARSLLLEALNDPDEEVRRLAVLGLAFHHETKALPPLLQMLSDPDEHPAMEAAVALERIGGDEAVAALINTMKTHPVLNVRAQAIDSVGRLRAREAIDALIELLSDEAPLDFEPASDRAARKALQRAGLEFSRRGLSPGSVASQPPGPRTIADLADRALRTITHESFDFRSTDPPERRKNAIQLWKAWAQRLHAA